MAKKRMINFISVAAKDIFQQNELTRGAIHFWTFINQEMHLDAISVRPKPKFANTFGRYRNGYQNHISKRKSSYIYFFNHKRDP